MTKVIERHLWEEFREYADKIRHTMEWKAIYPQRKETIERVFASAKENHGFRYTQMYGKARMEMKVGLTFAFMNLKSWRRLRSNGDSWRKKAQSQGLFYTIRLIKEKWLWDANPRAALSTV